MTSSRLFDLHRSPIEPGVTIIEASAGTGKTYCLTGLVLRALLEGHVKGARELLVVTFTNAATDELVGRIREALATGRKVLSGEEAPDEFFAHLAERHAGGDGASILRHALLDIDDLTVATIHGFCKRVLDEAAFEGGLPFDVELIENDGEIWLEACRDVWRRLLADEHLEETLLPVVIAEAGLEPGSFHEDFRQWRRHPGTELLPPALSLPEAAERLEVARRAAARAFKRVRWRMGLSRLKVKAGSELGSGDLRVTLQAAEGFLGGEPEGLWAVLRLRPEALRGAVERSAWGELEKLPGFSQIEIFAAAHQTLIHALRAHVLEETDERFSSAKTQFATHSFDDLLEQLRAALMHPGHGPRLRRAVRSRYQLALIDEFQDTDLVQYDIFRRLFGDAPLLLVGDPKQAIYRFRGADVFAYLGAKRRAKRLYTLNRNWRSGERLISAVNALFQKRPHPFVEDEIPYPEASSAPRAASRRLIGDGQGALVWLFLEREKQARRAVERILTATAGEVAALLNSGTGLASRDGGLERPLRPRDIAILVRTNEQAQQMQERLRQLGVPAVLGRSGDIYRSAELEEVLRLMDGVLAPNDSPRLRAACATVLWGDDAASLVELAEDDRYFAERVQTFSSYRDLWIERGFIAMMEQLLRERQVRRRLAGLDRGERRLTNLQHAIELVHRASYERHLSPTALLAWLRAEQRSEIHDRSAVELRLESDDEAVQLVTVHKSKGLEYEVVFCPFLWQARPVDSAPVLVHETPENLVYDCGSERLGRHLQLAEAERLAEDLRLTYVALTRARRRCYVVWGAIGRGPRSAGSGLGWLLHRAQEVLKRGDGPSETARRVAHGLVEIAERHGRWRGDLEDLVAANAETMTLRTLDDEEGAEKWSPDTRRDGILEATPLAQDAVNRLRTPWRISSFSSLTRGVSNDGHDHADFGLAAAKKGPAKGLFAFARGPRAGDCLHRIFEEIDFTQSGSRAIEEVVDQELRRFRLAAGEGHAREAPPDFDPRSAVLDMLRRVLESPLPGGLRLCEVDRASRLIEWQFYAPLDIENPSELAALFEQDAGAPWAQPYAERLRRLSPSSLQGFLTGFVDLVTCHQGRWYIVDWKSNHLGNHSDDYDLPAMTHAMLDHHYFLQAHIYAVALDRYLRLHQSDWSFSRDFGGIYYIFLRGVPDIASPDLSAASARAGQLGLFERPGTELSASPRESKMGTATQIRAQSKTDPGSGDPSRPPDSLNGVFFLEPNPRLIEILGRELLGTGELKP